MLKTQQAGKDLITLALDSHRGFPIPGESAFPFPGLFKPPANAQEEGSAIIVWSLLSNDFFIF